MSTITDARKDWIEHCKRVQEMTFVNDFEAQADKMKRINRAKTDYNFYVQTYFPHYTFDKSTGKNTDCGDFHIKWANAVKKDPSFLGVAEWPREHAKSVHNDIFLPIWLWINKELDGAVLTGKNETAACTLLGDVQAEFQFNERLKSDYGDQYNVGDWEDGDFVLKDNTYFMAIGRGQSPRGIRKGAKRPNLGLIDDIDDDVIVNSQDRVTGVVEWIFGAFYGCLDIRQSRMLMSGNRIHPKGILAHVVGDVEEGDPKREGLYHSKIFATTNGELTGDPTWWQKYTPEALHKRFKRMGDFLALKEFFHKYQIKGKIFKQEWVHWDKVPRMKEMDAIVAYFDPSYKNTTNADTKAWRVWGKKGIKKYLYKSFVRVCSITDAVKWAYDYYETIPEDVIVHFYMEDVFLQDEFFDDFETEGELRGYYLPVIGDKRNKPEKFARISTMTADYQRDNAIWDEKERKNPDAQTGYLQLMGFEKGSSIKDDAPDADESAWHLLNKMTRQEKFPGMLGKRVNKRIW
jgi:hypothetical protein